MSGGELDLDAIEEEYEAVKPEEFRSEEVETILALVAEVRRLRRALEVIAGDDLDYLGRLKLTDAENAIYVISRDALGRPA